MRAYLLGALYAAVAVLVACACFHTTFSRDETGVWRPSKLRNMRFFTQLSNLLAGVTALLCGVVLCMGARPFWTVALLYTATVSVQLTFWTVVLFLGIIYGYRAMFAGVNLILHLLVPALMLATFCLADTGGLTLAHAAIATAPMAVYGCFYIANVRIRGMGEGEHTNDWYSFLRWGWGIGAGIFALMALVTFGMAAGLLCLKSFFA